MFLVLIRHGSGDPATIPPAPPPDAESARAQQLEILLRLARSDSVYLLIDPEASSLELLSRGALLAEYRIRTLELATPEPLLGTRLPAGDWQSVAWEDGWILPKRRRLIVDLDMSAPDYEEKRKAHLIPPSPQERQPAPASWRVAFREGLVLEVVSEDSSGTRRTGRRPWILFPDRVRLRVILGEEDAAALYRSLPDGVRLALVPGGGRRTRSRSSRDRHVEVASGVPARIESTQ